MTNQAMLGVMQQMLELQRQAFSAMANLLQEHLNHARAIHGESVARWRNLLTRWEDQYPDLGHNCKKIYPVMERTFLHMLDNLALDLAEQGEHAFDSEFALQDFIDRNGVKLGQFGHLLSVIGPISEAGTQLQNQANESKKKDK